MHAVPARADHHRQRHRAHRGATSYTGIGIVKIFFQPGVDIRTANAQVTAISQTVLQQMPPGITPPLILNYNASTVPILQLALAGKGLSEQALSDLGHQHRAHAAGHRAGRGDSVPVSAARSRQIQIDLDPAAHAGARPVGQDVANALAAQNLITPVGTQKIGSFEYAHPAQQRAVGHRGAGRPADQDGQRRHGLSSATSPTCATATRRRPTSCTSTAPLGAAVGAEERRGLDARHHRRHQAAASRRSKPSLPDNAHDRADRRPVAVRARAPSAACALKA